MDETPSTRKLLSRGGKSAGSGAVDLLDLPDLSRTDVELDRNRPEIPGPRLDDVDVSPPLDAAVLGIVPLRQPVEQIGDRPLAHVLPAGPETRPRRGRSEEHTSELQSVMRNSYAVICLQQKTKKQIQNTDHV